MLAVRNAPSRYGQNRGQAGMMDLMDDGTRRRLMSMTHRFYETHAVEFSESRSGPWNAWYRLRTHIETLPLNAHVADIGCGNGRFLAFLRECGRSDLRYVGIDPTPTLLDIARGTHAQDRNASWHEGDIDTAAAAKCRGDLVVCFGVMHHIPGYRCRQEQFEQLARTVAPNGMLIVSFWKPSLLPSFERKRVSQVPQGLVLEENDHLLGWKGDDTLWRYCHDFTDEEIDELSANSELCVVESFTSEGNDSTNRYVVFRREY